METYGMSVEKLMEIITDLQDQTTQLKAQVVALSEILVEKNSKHEKEIENVRAECRCK